MRRTRIGADMKTVEFIGISRRQLLKGLAAAMALPAIPGVAAAGSGPRVLSFRNLHTGEHLSAEFHDGVEYLPDALTEIDHVLRDHRTGDVHPMDTGLLDLLHLLQNQAGASGSYEVISGFRSARTNSMLRQNSNGVAKRSLHMQGRAVDVRLSGFDTAALRKAAVSLRAGGVGYYARSNFIHLDTGRFRTW